MNFQYELTHFQLKHRDLERQAQRERLARLLRTTRRSESRNLSRLLARAFSLFL